MRHYANPIFSNVETTSSYTSENTATYQGITIKTLILLGIAGIVGVLCGILLDRTNSLGLYIGVTIASVIIGFISIILGRTNPKRSMVCGVIYSICEGAVLGMITLIADYYYKGIAVIAVASTATIFCVCLSLFACGAMRNVSTLRSILILTLCSIIAVSLVVFVMALFNIDGSGSVIKNYIGIVIFLELLYVLYGCIMLFFNFNEATSYVQNGATKDFEWMAAFGFLVSILYIYLEMIRLLLIIMRYTRRD